MNDFPQNISEVPSNENWNESERECNVMPNGDLIVQKVKLKKAKAKILGIEYEYFELALKTIGITAIFLPVWLFFQQQRAESSKRKALAKSEVYSKVTRTLHTILEKDMSDSSMKILWENLEYEIFPLVKLQEDEDVTKKLFNIKNNIALYLKCVMLKDNLNLFPSTLIELHTYLFPGSLRKDISDSEDSIIIHKLLENCAEAYVPFYNNAHMFKQKYISSLFDSSVLTSVIPYLAEQQLICDTIIRFQEKTISDFNIYISNLRKPYDFSVKTQHIRDSALRNYAQFDLLQKMQVDFLKTYRNYLLQENRAIDSLMNYSIR